MKLYHDIMKPEYVGLAWKFHVSPTSCDNPGFYGDYLRFSSLSDQNDGNAVTHLLIDKETNSIAGYFALRVCSMLTIAEDGKKLGIPALEIAEIAVAREYEHSGVGAFMISSTVAIAQTLREDTAGIKYISACADPAALGFYNKMNFNLANNIYEMPRDGWNNNCIPVYLRF